VQKKGVKFEWTSKCEESFQQLKGILDKCTNIEDCISKRRFFFVYHACKEGLNGVLGQRDHVVCYESLFKDMGPDH
jgi:hypothetical protein